MTDPSAIPDVPPAFSDGDHVAGEELLPLVYDELRRIAAARMAQQADGQTLQATALVHEAWLRLGEGRFESRAHFFSAAAQAMRHLLIERARRKLRARHGGGMERVDADEVEIAAPADDERLLQIHEALDELAAIAPEKAEVVKLRFFVGLEESEIAEVLGLSLRTVERYWAYAKSWLFDRIAKEGSGGPEKKCFLSGGCGARKSVLQRRPHFSPAHEHRRRQRRKPLRICTPDRGCRCPCRLSGRGLRRESGAAAAGGVAAARRDGG